MLKPQVAELGDTGGSTGRGGERSCRAMEKANPSPTTMETAATTDFYSWEYDPTWDDGMLPELCEKQEVQGFARTYQPAVYLLLLLLGTVGNGLVLLTHTRYRRAHSVTDVCLLHLALSDLLLLLTLPFAVTVTLQGWAPGTGRLQGAAGHLRPQLLRRLPLPHLHQRGSLRGHRAGAGRLPPAPAGSPPRLADGGAGLAASHAAGAAPVHLRPSGAAPGPPDLPRRLPPGGLAGGSGGHQPGAGRAGLRRCPSW
uniref:C-C motif chemokine receptor 10 n=1 Tax=Anas platyrhynchos TaxID=8839 RepID=A0A8B9ZBI1_ANAPL